MGSVGHVNGTKTYWKARVVQDASAHWVVLSKVASGHEVQAAKIVVVAWAGGSMELGQVAAGGVDVLNTRNNSGGVTNQCFVACSL